MQPPGTKGGSPESTEPKREEAGEEEGLLVWVTPSKTHFWSQSSLISTLPVQDPTTSQSATRGRPPTHSTPLATPRT